VDADVFVLPSHQEGFSMAITEALAAACPVVVTEECNFDEVGPSDAGRIIRGGDMAAFVGAVAELLADPAARQRMGSNGAALVRGRYTWDRIAADLDAVYQWVLAGKPLPASGADVWREGAVG
jgi:glycosyltransferase involved in cell wall biosynthesis